MFANFGINLAEIGIGAWAGACNKSSAELLKIRPRQAQASALFYARLTSKPGPSSPSLGSFHFYITNTQAWI